MMSSPFPITDPLFGKKHYDYLIRELDDPSREMVDELCRVFKKDRPAFDPDLFRYLINQIKKERKHDPI